MSTSFSGGCNIVSSKVVVAPFNPVLNGPTIVCSSTNFHLTDIAPGTTATWSVTPSGLLAANSGTGTSVNLVPASPSSSGQATLTFNVTGSCGTVQRTNLIQVGVVNSSEVSVSGASSVCPGGQYTYEANVPGGHQAGYVYQWSIPPGWSIQNQWNNFITLYVPSTYQSFETVRFRVNNGCGFSTYSGLTVFPGFECSGPFSATIFPNPVSDELHLEIEQNKDEAAKVLDAENFEIGLFDLTGNRIYHLVTSETQITIDVRHLKSGFYYLHILHKDGLIRKQIRVEK